MIVTHDPPVSGQVRRTVRIRDGRTSTEVLRPAAGGGAEDAVLDRAGRLRLPREYTERHGPRHRVRLTAEDDHIGVWPDREADQAGEEA